MLKFFRIPFATGGDKTDIPDATDANGNVSYSQGYGFDYQRQKTDPSAKNIERDKTNQLFFDLTTAIAELQKQGVPDFITSALNGGTAYSYAQNAIVSYSGALYISLAAANTALPTDATKWALLPTPARVRDGSNVVAASAGTVDAVTLTLTPAQTAFASGPTWWRATGANTSTTPTVKRDALAAKTLVKGNNLPLVAGDIPGAGAWMVTQYDATLDKEVLLNPATGVSNVSAANLQTQTFTAFTTGGATGAFTLTPAPALTSYAANQRFRVKFHAAGSGTDTINVSGLGVKSLKQYDAAGAKASPVIAANMLVDVEYDGVDFVIHDPLPASIPAALNASGTAPIYAARAWVNFNGTGTVAIRASGNVSSITDNGTGDYTINFTVAMADANYATLVSGVQTTTQGGGIASYTAASVRVRFFNTYTQSINYNDTDTLCVACFR